jgi:hypothetical protein
MNRVCEVCGEGFWQGRGRPAKRCPRCRNSDRYGPTHRAMKAAGPTYGAACTRCGRVLLPGQAVEPDHLDGGGPQDYAGWAHAGCNHSAGAARGNQLRAAAYRAARGLPAPSPNGVAAPGARAVEQPACRRTREEVTASPGPLPCVCGRVTSRCW